MRVQHSVYGQGTLISTDGQMSKVLFDSGLTKDVPAIELLDVILGL